VPLTPADIHNVEFTKASLGKRGYDEEQVDALLDEVTQEMIKLLEENELLARRADSAAVDDFAAAPRMPRLDDLTAALETARRECDRAEQHALRVRDQLNQARRAKPAATPATEPNEQVMALAQRTAHDHMDQADHESVAMVADAREQSERMIREAEQTVTAIEQDSRRHRTEADADVRKRQADMVREIAELTRFTQDYRSALENHIARQFDHLEGIEAPVPQP
jgi:DivIVA domain-containing protein